MANPLLKKWVRNPHHTKLVKSALYKLETMAASIRQMSPEEFRDLVKNIPPADWKAIELLENERKLFDF